MSNILLNYVTVGDNIDASEGLGHSTNSLTSSLTREEYRYCQTLLNTVKHDWIDDYLKQSLYNKILIKLGLQEQQDAVERQTLKGVVDLPARPRTTLLKDTDATDIFEQMGHGRTL